MNLTPVAWEHGTGVQVYWLIVSSDFRTGIVDQLKSANSGHFSPTR